MQHHFDIYIAEQYGILEAILLNHFEFWIAKNEANEKNYYDDEYWTYNSTKALQKLFPYVSQRKIQNALKHLIDEGVLMTGNYNKSAYDRTLWYAFTEKGKCIMQKCKMEDANLLNQLCNNVQPIPDNNTYNDKDNNSVSEDVTEIIDYLNMRLGTRYQSTTKVTKDAIKARLNEHFTVQDFKDVIDKKCIEWANDEKMAKYLRPQTLFGNKFEAYLNEPVVKQSTGNKFLDALQKGEFRE